MEFPDIHRPYRNLFVIESRAWLFERSLGFDPELDMVLSYDFAVVDEVRRRGGQAFYLDHLVDQETMQKNNFLTYDFFRTWNLDEKGEDIFTHAGIPFGFSFRLEFWNDLTSYVRTCLCLDQVRRLRYERLLVGTSQEALEALLAEMGLSFQKIERRTDNATPPSYYFPIHAWMDEKVRHSGWAGLKYRLRDLLGFLQAVLMVSVDRLYPTKQKKPAVFVQEYYPTRSLIRRLAQEQRVRVVLATFSRSPGWFRYVPIYGRTAKYSAEARLLLEDFARRRHARLVLTGGLDITDGIYQIITDRIAGRVAKALRDLDCVIRYLDRHPVRLVVLIANIGQVASLVDCVARVKRIPSYLIINGLMGGDFLDEAKYADIINAYSESIRSHYFRGMDNIVCLGDPRMDDYILRGQQRQVNRQTPTITIGTSAYSVVDLNSYVAVEFDFMHDVLVALNKLKQEGKSMRIVLKVRANGYLAQYRQFSDQYFPELVDEICQNVPMQNVLERTDFYITTYSQTLFEASSLGIPCVYYKRDDELLDPPFDEKSELTTVSDIDGLVSIINEFYAGSQCFDAFLRKSVMEQYIGPLDGRNLERNLNQIYGMLNQSISGTRP